MKCGGCRDLGPHDRWCRQVVGYRSSRIGTMADQLQDMGVFIGSSNAELATRCFDLGIVMLAAAKNEAERFQNRDY